MGICFWEKDNKILDFVFSSKVSLLHLTQYPLSISTTCSMRTPKKEQDSEGMDSGVSKALI